jgi:fibronectin-binding autotransporter adhesin
MKTPMKHLSSTNGFGPRCLALLCLLLPAALPGSAQAATISKANNADNLILGSSWVGATAPGSADTAQWDSAVIGANTTVLGGNTNWNNIVIAGVGGPVTINADGNTLTIGTSTRAINMDSAAADFTVNCPITLGNSQTNSVALGRTLTLNGILSGSFALTKTNEGIMVLNGANTHTTTFIGDGTLHCGVVSIGNSTALGAGGITMNGTGGAALWLSGGITVANNLVVNGAAGNGVTDYGNIRNVSGSNTITGTLTGNASPRIGCDLGTLEFKTGGFTLGANTAARGPNFIGAGDIIVSAPIRKFTAGTAANTCGHALSTGTLRLSGANTYTGATTIGSGTTMADYGPGANVLPDATVLTFGGGALTISGGSVLDVVASTSILSGGSAVTRSSGTSVLRLNAIARSVGATVDFGMAGVADTDTANVNGILGGYATLAGTDWAINSTGGADGTITAYSGYQTATAPGSWAATDNVTLAGNPSANVPATTINSLRLTGASTVTIDAGATLTNSSGGLLITGSSATSIASGGAGATLVGANGSDLIVQQYSGSDATISAVIGNNTSATRLTKTGPGKLILSGANTYTGNTYINAGTLSISANSNLGDPGTATAIVFNGGTLQATASFALNNGAGVNRGFTMNDFTTGTVDVTGANVLAFPGLIGGRGWLTKTGTGTLVLAGASTTYQGDFLLNGGYVTAGVAETPGTSGPFGNQATGASVSGVACFLHFGGGTLQYSGVNNFDYSYRFSSDDNQAYSVDTAGQNVTWASALNSRDGSLSKSGLGLLTLSAANNYNGRTTINAGTVALFGGGKFAKSSQVSIAAGATLDVSFASSLGLGSSTALSASGTGTTVGTTAAAISGPLAGNVNLGTRPITLAYDGSNPALYVPQGTLQVQGNAWTINGAALSPSTAYTIASQLGGSAGVSGVHTVYGTAIAGMNGTISGSGANVQLTTSAAGIPTTTSVGSSANPSTYGTAPTLTATVSGAGASGTVLFVLDDVPQSPAVAVSGGTASFTPANSLSAGTHTVVAQYSGDGTYGSSVSTTFDQTVSPKAVTMVGLSVPASRVYDGTALAYVSGIPALLAPEAFGAGTSSDGKPYTGDAVSVNGLATGTYNSRDVATATTVTFGGLYLLGSQAANYSLTIQSPASATITPKALTAASPAVTTKLYDGGIATTVTGSLQTAEAPGSGLASDGKPFTGDALTLNLSGNFVDKNVGTGKSVTSTSTLGGAQAGDYSLTQPTLTGNISKTNITVTAATNTKPYDGSTSAAAIPTVTPGSIQTGDNAAFTESYDNSNVGTGKTLTPAGSVTDGNGGANYNVTFVANLTGEITAVGTTTGLLSSTNPSTETSNVTFTATVSSGVGTPTGNVVFKANAVPFSTNTLVSGAASASTTTLPVGTNTVTAEYAAQANWLTSTGSVQQVVNSAVVYSQTNAILSIVDNGNGTFGLTLQGTPQAEYYLLASPDVTAAMNTWSPVLGSTNTAPGPSGQWSSTVSNAAPQYYRLKAVNPAP